jgi:hypothetical protein
VFSALAGVFMYSCAGFETVKLDTRQDKPTYKVGADKGVVVGDTVIFDFRGTIDHWWKDPKYTISKVGDQMKIKANGVGPKYEPVGCSFNPLNFSQAQFLKVKIRLEEGTTTFPTIRFDLKDVYEYATNASPPSVVIDSAGYKIYIFDYFKKFKQFYPEVHDVDYTKIGGIQFFVNPGGAPYYGTFYIDEISTTVNPNGSGIVPNEFIVDNFSGAFDWWSCNSEKVTLAKAGSTMKVHYNDSKSDCFGKIIGEVDVDEFPVIKVRAKATSADGAQFKTNLTCRFIDADENTTDLTDANNLVDFEVGGTEFKDYYCVFKNSTFNNLKSSSGKFNPKKVTKMVVFVNLGKPNGFTGDVIVDEISFVKQVPK